MTSSPGTADNSDRARLTEKEKKQNHILSEQKRRQAIRAGFDRLAALIPGMQGQGRSEAVVLENAVKREELENRRRQKLEKLLVPDRMSTEEFAAAYKVSIVTDKNEAEMAAAAVKDEVKPEM